MPDELPHDLQQQLEELLGNLDLADANAQTTFSFWDFANFVLDDFDIAVSPA